MSASRPVAAAQTLLEIELSGAAQKFEPTCLSAADGNPAGFVLLRRDLSPEDLRCVRSQLQSLPLNTSDSCYPAVRKENPSASPSAGLLNADSFCASLEQELSRIAETRLPCSLILVQTDTDSALSTLVNRNTQPGEIHGCSSPDTVGIILPETGLGRARRRAEHLRAAILKENAPANPAAFHRIALATCKPGHAMRNRKLLQAVAELLFTCGTACGEIPAALFPAKEDDSCQVTVEERAHLFRFMD